jgi:thiol-disulfide isomerase/thioredoxin
VVVFWSLHCGFCERHNEHIEKLHRAAAGKPLRVLGVLAEQDRDAARRRMAQRGWTFPLTVDRDPLAAALTARRSVPLTVTVDRAGRLRELIPGEMFEADVLDLIKLAS